MVQVSREVRQELLERAVNAVQGGTFQRAAASLSGVSRSTFCRMLKGPRRSKRPVGRPSLLTNAEEQTLVDTILEFSNTGIPLSRVSIVALTRLFIDNLHCPTKGHWVC